MPGLCALTWRRAGYSINSVLYQRGLYPPENFTAVKKYGLQMMVSTDAGLSKYLASVLQQLSGARLCCSDFRALISP